MDEILKERMTETSTDDLEAKIQDKKIAGDGPKQLMVETSNFFEPKVQGKTGMYDVHDVAIHDIVKHCPSDAAPFRKQVTREGTRTRDLDGLVAELLAHLSAT